MNKSITILGPTASGKTKLAVHLAKAIDGEIISADSRQVYRGMNIGAGKDLKEYTVDGLKIPYHLIDIRDAGEKYNLHDFQRDYRTALNSILSRGKKPILAGGSGLYIQSVLEDYRFTSIPVDGSVRKELQDLPEDELANRFEQISPEVRSFADGSTRKRMLRAVEIDAWVRENGLPESDHIEQSTVLLGIDIDREERRKRITERLHARLEEGMIEEVQYLMELGVPAETLEYYGLEYKWVTKYLKGEIGRDAMIERLNTAIHQFAKRQMTWFRKMEREGHEIHWIPWNLPIDRKVKTALGLLDR